LTAHPAGYWCKKIRGKLHYFGPWSDPDAALAKYLEQKDDLHAGRTPRADPAALTVKGVANAFLNAKREALEAGGLSPRTWADWTVPHEPAPIVRAVPPDVGRLPLHHGHAGRGAGQAPERHRPGPQDFAGLKNKLAKRNGPHRMCTVIQVSRCAFKHAYESDLVDRPVRFGPEFKRTSKKTLRLHRARQGPELFTAEEIRQLIGAAGTHLRVMILLGINCGFGNADCGTLPVSALDLERGWVTYPRPKTGIPRRAALWPETVQALKEARAKRPEPKKAEHAGLVFVTKYGLSWSKDDSSGPIGQETRKLLAALGINGRKGLGFYTLRHTFRTIAGEAKDQPAADFIMGHEVPHMSSVYRETISDERLRAVTGHVPAWLFTEPQKAAPGGEPVLPSNHPAPR
jgi:integrase